MKGKKKGTKTPKKMINFTEVFEVPKDVMLGEAIITLTGKREALIENYKGIVEYTDEYIKILTKNGVIEFKGSNFNITYLTNEEIKVAGSIVEINY
ncbi:MAG: YabP/YqfC family sporulation protein [Vallitaleaceae bacterium]|nr:YabP/YqfC family sporulation protein [Vallitaleaceae bacterium]